MNNIREITAAISRAQDRIKNGQKLLHSDDLATFKKARWLIDDGMCQISELNEEAGLHELRMEQEAEALEPDETDSDFQGYPVGS